MDPTPDSHVPTPTTLVPLVDRTAQQEQPARSRFFTFALIGGSIAFLLFFLTFLTTLRAQTPHPQNSLKLTPIVPPAEIKPTPRARAIPSPQPVQNATNSATQIPPSFETPAVSPVPGLEDAPTAVSSP